MTSVEPDVFEPDEVPELLELIGSEDPKWTIDSLGKADWAMRKLGQATANMKARDLLVNDEIKRLIEWAEQANKVDKNTIAFFEGQLRKYHESVIQADPSDEKAWKKEENKTVQLPGGELSFAKNPTSIDVDDEVFIPWALANQPDWVKVKREVTRTPIKAEIKKALDDGRLADPETGETVPGVKVHAAELRWEASPL